MILHQRRGAWAPSEGHPRRSRPPLSPASPAPDVMRSFPPPPPPIPPSHLHHQHLAQLKLLNGTCHRQH